MLVHKSYCCAERFLLIFVNLNKLNACTNDPYMEKKNNREIWETAKGKNKYLNEVGFHENVTKFYFVVQ